MSPEDKNEATFSDLMSCKETSDLKEGTHIDRYQILGLIGKGGMGAVYKAYDPELDRSIAIKILTAKPHVGESVSRPQARLMREAKALAKLSHPNVVSIFDVGTYEDSVYIAMEYVKGNTLREWLKDEHQAPCGATALPVGTVEGTESTAGAASRKPTQKEIIRVLLEAGKGLQAAHSEGIIHRDFKPDNVIVGDSDQVKVLDFGLAKAAHLEESKAHFEQKELDRETISGDKLLSAPLTHFGAYIGTAAYMAPENFLGHTLDEKTDQFSFCVTLFEALYGKRPFSGKTLEELKENVIDGVIQVPQDADVPKWIEDIVCNGMSVSKDDRYQSMAELLNDLEQDPEVAKAVKRKKITISAAFFLLTSIILMLGYYAIYKDSEVCTGADIKTASIWNEGKKEKIKRAFAKTELSYANDSFKRVKKRLGNYLSKWSSAYTETCETTRIRAEQPVEIMVLKMGCLDKHLMDTRALVNIFGEADKTVVEKAVQAVSSLSGFSNCNDVEALQSRIPPPKDEKTRSKVAAIRGRLAEVEALRKTGKYRDGLALVRKLKKEANSVGYRPLQADVLYKFGVLQANIGEYKKAEKTLYEAASQAGKSKDILLAGKAMANLVAVIGYKQARFELALSIARDTDILMSISDANDIEQSMLLNNMGLVLWKKGEHDKALEYQQNALKIRQKELGANHPLVAMSLSNIGSVYWNKGEYLKSLNYYQKTLAILKNVLGAEHPHVAQVIHNMGFIFKEQGNYNKALEYYRRSLAIWKNVLGSEHPYVAHSLHAMSVVFGKSGEYLKALDYSRKAITIWETAFGTEHPMVAEALCNKGSVLLNLGNPEKALKLLERYAAICERQPCDPVQHGIGIFSLSRALVATGGDKGRAIKLSKQAQDIFRKTPKRFKNELEAVSAWLEKYGFAKDTPKPHNMYPEYGHRNPDPRGDGKHNRHRGKGLGPYETRKHQSGSIEDTPKKSRSGSAEGQSLAKQYK